MDDGPPTSFFPVGALSDTRHRGVVLPAGAIPCSSGVDLLSWHRQARVTRRGREGTKTDKDTAAPHEITVTRIGYLYSKFNTSQVASSMFEIEHRCYQLRFALC